MFILRLSPVKRSAVRPIALRSGNTALSGGMALLARIELSGTEKLDVLQRLDRYRKWQSLDDKCYCLACGHLIDGHDIQVVGGTRGTGPLRMICSTRGCHSIPMD